MTFEEAETEQAADELHERVVLLRPVFTACAGVNPQV
jgi:hypothetical protein